MVDKQSTRERIVVEGDRLFYEQGFEHTSFAQIAEAVGISRGNFYYHFKTKDDILDAVIAYRVEKTSGMLEQWALAGESPADRIRSFIGILMRNREKIMQFGCPVGTLTNELMKLEHPSHDAANRLFTMFRDWLRLQFEQLGHHDEADQLAMHLLALSQGVATLASTYRDEVFIQQEVERLNQWLNAYT